MAMVVVHDSCLQANSQPKSGGLVWWSSAAWHCSTFIKWTRGLPLDPTGGLPSQTPLLWSPKNP